MNSILLFVVVFAEHSSSYAKCLNVQHNLFSCILFCIHLLCQTVIQYSLTSTSSGPKLNKEKVNDLRTSRAPWHQVCFQTRYTLNLLRITLDAQCENKCCGDANLFCFKCEVHWLNSRRSYMNPSQRDAAVETLRMHQFIFIKVHNDKKNVKRNLFILHMNNSPSCQVCLGLKYH